MFPPLRRREILRSVGVSSPTDRSVTKPHLAALKTGAIPLFEGSKMKFFLISDNRDTYTGMRLAGIEGVVVHEAEEVNKALDSAMEDEETAVVLITEKLVDLCGDRISHFKLTVNRPLIVEIPDRHLTGDVSGSIEKYVREAVGIKL